MSNGDNLTVIASIFCGSAYHGASTNSFKPSTSATSSNRTPFAALSDADSVETSMPLYSAHTPSTRAEGSSCGGQFAGSRTSSQIAS